MADVQSPEAASSEIYSGILGIVSLLSSNPGRIWGISVYCGEGLIVYS